MKTLTRLAQVLLSGLLLANTPAFAEDKAKPDVDAKQDVKQDAQPADKAENTPDTGISLGTKQAPSEVKMQETRINGQLKEVEVKTAVSTYTLPADPKIGNAAKGTAQGSNNRPAMFKVIEFGGGKKPAEKAPARSKRPAPPPPEMKQE